jgi:hypothetical protein
VESSRRTANTSRQGLTHAWQLAGFCTCVLLAVRFIHVITEQGRHQQGKSKLSHCWNRKSKVKRDGV